MMADHESDSDADGETAIARLTRWIRQRPNSIELWELVVTDERLAWCFVGESYRSMLLRADMGERDRAIVEDSHLEGLETLAEENFSVPLSALESIRHVEGTRFRRARLELEWRADDADETRYDGQMTLVSTSDADETRYDGQMTLVSTSDADSQRDLVAALADDPRLEHVEIDLEEPRWSIF